MANAQRQVSVARVLFAVLLCAMNVELVMSAEAALPDLGTYVYAGDDLGATYTPSQTTIKLWAPTAKSVSIALFDSAAKESSEIIPMERDLNGIWSAIIKGDYDGKHYLYDGTHSTA